MGNGETNGSTGPVATASRPGGTRRAGMIATLLVLVALGVGATVGLGWQRSAEPDALCVGLGGGVAGLDIIRWDNGFTESGPSWFAALTEGIAHGDAATRRAIAETVAADATGYEQVVARLGPTDRAAFDRLRVVATHPDQRPSADDPEIVSAIATVRSIARSRCNLV